MCLDSKLGGEIAFGPECVEVAAVAHKAVMRLSPEIGIGVSRHEKLGIRNICLGSLSQRPFLKLCNGVSCDNTRDCSCASFVDWLPLEPIHRQQTGIEPDNPVRAETPISCFKVGCLNKAGIACVRAAHVVETRWRKNSRPVTGGRGHSSRRFAALEDS